MNTHQSIEKPVGALGDRVPPSPALVDLRRTVSDVVNQVEPLLCITNVETSARFGYCTRWGRLGPTEVILSEQRLKRVLHDVIVNAVKTSSPESSVAIQISTTSDVAKICVRNAIGSPGLGTMADPTQSDLTVARNLSTAIGGTVAIAIINGVQYVTLIIPRQFFDTG